MNDNEQARQRRHMGERDRAALALSEHKQRLEALRERFSKVWTPRARNDLRTAIANVEDARQAMLGAVVQYASDRQRQEAREMREIAQRAEGMLRRHAVFRQRAAEWQAACREGGGDAPGGTGTLAGGTGLPEPQTLGGGGL